MPVKFEFFFDISSPWTYLAFHNVRAIAREFGVTIGWRPVLVGGIFNTINPSVYASREQPVPAKAAYLDKDLRDWASASGLSLVWPPAVFPVNSVKAMRGCLVAMRHGRLEDLANAFFDLYWAENQDISQDEILARGCERIGFEQNIFFDGIAESAIKQQLKDNTDELMRRGGFGVPTMFINESDMYFGNDRLILVREAFERLMTRP
ncbi:MAG: 2-hydroxychromene-2-carboxylate isomerase [Rhodospirillaceae bacterium]